MNRRNVFLQREYQNSCVSKIHHIIFIALSLFGQLFGEFAMTVVPSFCPDPWKIPLPRSSLIVKEYPSTLVRI